MNKMQICLFLLWAIKNTAFTQDLNCYCFKNDSLQYLACEKYMKQCYGSNNPEIYYQGSKASQLGLDTIINICPDFSYAYYTKSIPYLKRGDFITWKYLIDKAVELNPSEFLGYRAGARFMFLRDYNGALNDIEILEKASDFDIGSIYNGDYHLTEIKALCFKYKGAKKKAIEILDSYLKINSSSIFGHLHLGVLYLETGSYQNAIIELNTQIRNFPFSEAYYYLALAYRKNGNNISYQENICLAKRLYTQGNTMDRDYVTYPDKIYLQEILSETYQ